MIKQDKQILNSICLELGLWHNLEVLSLFLGKLILSS